MGIHYLQPQKYKCSKCGSTSGHKYSRSAKPKRQGTYEGISCPDCGHKTEHYVPSLMELEMGSSRSWSHDPNKPIEF